MTTIPADILRRVRQHGQEHILAWWDKLDETQARELIDQLQGIDFDLLDRLYAEQRSLQLDLRILAWTAIAVLLRQNVAVNRTTGQLTWRRRPKQIAMTVLESRP